MAMMLLPVTITDGFNCIGFKVMRNAIVMSILSLLILTPVSVWADAPAINWNALNLNPSQQATIQQLEAQWQSTYREVNPRIITERERLRQMIQHNKPEEGEVITIQNNIQSSESQLRDEATRTFMRKQNVLTDEQRQLLHQMLGQ